MDDAALGPDSSGACAATSHSDNFVGSRTRGVRLDSRVAQASGSWGVRGAPRLIRRQCSSGLAQLICSWNFTNSCVVDQSKFFRALGQRVRQLRKARGYSQEDMISFGFSARHWHQIEAGRPVTMRTAPRICEVFKTSMERLVRGLDSGVYRI
jgi:hypothetical protein